ncbi:MAG: XdhC family protein [Anaerolineaceae bacterium]|nr:XdhC family protein [Anaerolineaceae bacterium]
MFDEFFRKANELTQAGELFATAVVVRAEKPTSAKPGDKAIITADSVMHGWIGGSCAQPTVINESLKAIADGQPRLIRLSVDPDQDPARPGVVDLPLTCFSGGTLEIYIEPQRPLPHLLVVGSLPVARALVQLGTAMNYRITVIDPDTAGEGMETADRLITELDEMPALLTPRTFVVVATHGNYDELALTHALQAPVAYVGLVASKKRKQAVEEYLQMHGLSEHEIGRLVCPAGLDIQAVRGDEIALSIMAQIVQQRRSDPEIDIGAFFVRREAKVAEAIDQVCGMAVTIEGAAHTHTYEGTTYYFCCAGCQAKFAANPEQYLQQAVPSGTAVDPICQMEVEIATAKFMSEHDGEPYYFCCAGCQKTFDSNPMAALLKNSETAVQLDNIMT